VIRLGKVVGETSRAAPESELASMMVGRAVSLTVEKGPAEPGTRVLAVDGLTVVDSRGQVAVDDVSFDVRAGELLTVAGVQGNGQTELAEAIVGLQERVAGSVMLNGTELVGRSVREVLRAGVGFIPEDRTVDGLVSTFTVAENLVLDMYDQPPYATGFGMKPSVVRDNARHRIEEFDIRAESIDTTASTLSGGNLQKVVVARELSRPLQLLVASQPTRGLDVGSIEFVHRRLIEERDRGTAVLMISTELDEVSALADRVLVMYRGQVVGIVPGDTDRDVLGLMMAGVSPDDAAGQAAATPPSDASTRGGTDLPSDGSGGAGD
ncbi:MAG: ATP-binding cassette domain-containing protein, partial [Jiangellaceae bacterium]